MRTAKVWLVAALALAAMALAAAPAFATTIVEAGGIVATENGPGTLDNGAISVTCTTSDATATVTNDGTGTIDTLSFGGGGGTCEETISGASCTIVVTGLPQASHITGTTSPNGTMTLTDPVTAGATIDCGTLACEATVNTNLTATVTGGSAPRLDINNEDVNVTGAGCTLGIPGTWDSSWTINSTASGTDTTLTITEP